METNTTSFWIEYWICEKVVQIDQHSQQKYKPSFAPDVVEKVPSDYPWKDQMKEIVNECLNHHIEIFIELPGFSNNKNR